MPVVSQQQNRAMHAAASGHSTLGIPASVGKEYVNASHGMGVSTLPQHRPSSSVEAITGLPSGKKTHRGKRSRGKHPQKAEAHFTALQSAMVAGDHAKAKSSALHLANALHAHLKSSANAVDGLDTPSLTQPLGGL